MPGIKDLKQRILREKAITEPECFWGLVVLRKKKLQQ